MNNQFLLKISVDMEKKLVMRTITLARLISLPTLMVIAGLSFTTQVLPSASVIEGSVLNNPQQDGDLYMAKNYEPRDPCYPASCEGEK